VASVPARPPTDPPPARAHRVSVVSNAPPIPLHPGSAQRSLWRSSSFLFVSSRALWQLYRRKPGFDQDLVEQAEEYGSWLALPINGSAI
jgi:hypothetical protein